MILNGTRSLLDLAVEVASAARNASDFVFDKSYVSESAVARVEPFSIISQDLIGIEYIDDVMLSALNITVAFYLQSVALTAQIGDVKVKKILDRLNPGRNINTVLDSMASVDSAHGNVSTYEDRLPIESGWDNSRISMLSAKVKKTDDRNKASFNIKDDSQPLTVGKLIDVELKVGGDSAKIPVTVRLTSVPENIDVLHGIMTIQGYDVSISERWYQYRAGMITGREFLLDTDLMRERKKLLLKSKTGVLEEVAKRSQRGKLWGALTGEPSLATASSVYIISEEVARRVERSLRGKLSSARVRKKIFGATKAMMIIVVDRDRERAIFYYRGIDQGTNLSIRQIKKSNKNKGPDIKDVMAAFMGIGGKPASAPVF